MLIETHQRNIFPNIYIIRDMIQNIDQIKKNFQSQHATSQTLKNPILTQRKGFLYSLHLHDLVCPKVSCRYIRIQFISQKFVRIYFSDMRNKLFIKIKISANLPCLSGIYIILSLKEPDTFFKVPEQGLIFLFSVYFEIKQI